MTNKKHVVIVGGGFGGVKTALELAGEADLFDITLISNEPGFRYYPTLYHTATGGTAAQSELSLAELFKGKPVELVQATVTTLDRGKKQLTTADKQRIGYDILVLSLGTVTNYFGIPEMDKLSYSIKSVPEAKRFKAFLHQQIEENRRPDLSYVVIGGGPTGIELAGELPGYLKRVAEAHDISPKGIHVDLIEAMPNLVPRLPEKMGKQITKRLKKLGVNVYLGKKVEAIEPGKLTVSGQPIQSHTIVWTAGMANNPFFSDNNFTLTERRKVKVDEFLQAESDIFVIGDNADTQYSGMAQTALYDAVCLAHNLVVQARGDAMKPYVPKPPITVIPVGPHWAAVQWGKTMLFGKFGWLLRLAADTRAYSDYQPWWKVPPQVLTEFVGEEECGVCARHFV
jgi:NADH:ubiquinone reductase (H+-translocating)